MAKANARINPRVLPCTHHTPEGRRPDFLSQGVWTLRNDPRHVTRSIRQTPGISEPAAIRKTCAACVAYGQFVWYGRDQASARLSTPGELGTGEFSDEIRPRRRTLQSGDQFPAVIRTLYCTRWSLIVKEFWPLRAFSAAPQPQMLLSLALLSRTLPALQSSALPSLPC